VRCWPDSTSSKIVPFGLTRLAQAGWDEHGPGCMWGRPDWCRRPHWSLRRLGSTPILQLMGRTAAPNSSLPAALSGRHGTGATLAGCAGVSTRFAGAGPRRRIQPIGAAGIRRTQAATAGEWCTISTSDRPPARCLRGVAIGALPAPHRDGEDIAGEQPGGEFTSRPPLCATAVWSAEGGCAPARLRQRILQGLAHGLCLMPGTGKLTEILRGEPRHNDPWGLITGPHIRPGARQASPE